MSDERISNKSISGSVDDGVCEDVLTTQRLLRTELLDGQNVRFHEARNLAAHMLLYLDDLTACWYVATNWLREELGCSRVDTGFGSPDAKQYFPSYAEAKNSNYFVPTLGGPPVDNQDRAMQAMWHAKRPLIFEDVMQDRRFEIGLRKRLNKARTKSKFAGALRTRDGSFGLICADWTEHHVPWKGDIYDHFEHTVADVLSPIIAASLEFDERKRADANIAQQETQAATMPASPLQSSNMIALTNSELEVARLVAKGLSYKEIANARGRSFSTIDHQLRSIRRKIGVSSTSGLVSYLARYQFREH